MQHPGGGDHAASVFGVKVMLFIDKLQFLAEFHKVSESEGSVTTLLGCARQSEQFDANLDRGFL